MSLDAKGYKCTGPKKGANGSRYSIWDCSMTSDPLASTGFYGTSALSIDFVSATVSRSNSGLLAYTAGKMFYTPGPAGQANQWVIDTVGQVSQGVTRETMIGGVRLLLGGNQNMVFLQVGQLTE